MKLYRIGIHECVLNFSEDTTNPTIYEEKDKLMDIKCKIDLCDSKKWEEVKKKDYLLIRGKTMDNKYLPQEFIDSLMENYDEKLVAEYMKGENIDIYVDLFTGTKSFTAFTMDFTKNYIEINADYRS